MMTMPKEFGLALYKCTVFKNHVKMRCRSCKAAKEQTGSYGHRVRKKNLKPLTIMGILVPKRFRGKRQKEFVVEFKHYAVPFCH